MVEHTCPRCGKVFNHKGPYDYHVYKMKRPCKVKNKKPSHRTLPNATQKGHSLWCSKCNKSFASRYSLNRHLSKYCKPTRDKHNYTDTNSRSSKPQQQLPTEQDLVIQQPEFQVPKHQSSQIPQNSAINPQNPSHNTKSEHTCNYCLKNFSRSDNLSRHLDLYCKVKKQQDNEKEKIFKSLLEQMEELKKQNNKIIKENKQLRKDNKNLMTKVTHNVNSHNITNNHNTQNNTQNNIKNNVNIVAFGEEDLSYISDKVCKYFLKKGYQSVPQLIEHIHFNKNKPEYNNVYIPNMRDIYAMIFDGSEWNLGDKKEVIQQLFDDKHFFLENKFDELMGTLDDVTKKKFKRFLDSLKNADTKDNRKIINNLKNEIKLLLYNKRNLIIDTRSKQFIDNK